MSILRKKNDVTLTVDTNAVHGPVVLGENIKVDGQHYVVDTLQDSPLGLTAALDIFGDGSCFAAYELESDGTDLSGNHTGTVNGTPAFSAGKFGNAIDLVTDVNKFVQVTDNDAFSPLVGPVSVSFWVKMLGVTNNSYAIAKGYNPNYEYSANISATGAITFTMHKDGGGLAHLAVTAAAAIPASTWTHVVVTMEHNVKLEVFVDKVSVGSDTTPDSTMYNTGHDLFFGKREFAASGFDGSMDQVRFFNKVVSQDEIDTLFIEGFKKVLTTTPVLPGTITAATTEYKTKLAVTDNIPDVTQLFIGDDILVDGTDYNITNVVYPSDTTQVLDVLEDSSCLAGYTLDATADGVEGVSNGTPVNITYGTGNFGQGAIFDGTAYIDTPVTLTGTPMSISAFIKLDTIGITQVIVNTTQTATDHGYLFWINSSNQLVLSVYSGALRGTVTSTATLTTGVWYHVVATSTNTTAAGGIEIFIDSVSEDSGAVTVIPGAQTYNPRVGAYPSPASSYFEGTMDQVRYFNKVITTLEMTDLANEVDLVGSLTTTPTLPGTVTDAYVKHMSAIGVQKAPSAPVDDLVQISTVSDAPSVMTVSDVTNITINHTVANGDIVYARNANVAMADVTVASVIDNGDGTWSFAHGQAFTPTAAYMGNSVELDFSVDSYDTLEGPTKTAATLVSNDLTGVHDIFGDATAIATVPFDTALTDVGGNYDVTAVGTHNYITGKFNDASDSPTVNDWKRIDGLGTWFANRTTWSIAMWAQPSSVQAGVAMLFCVSFTSHVSPYYRLELKFTTADISFRATHNTSPVITSTVTRNVGTWYHITCTFSSGNIELFVDGVSVGTAVSTNSDMGACFADATFGRIPAFLDPTHARDTRIDQFRVFSGVLSQADIDLLQLETLYDVTENYSDIALGAPAALIDHKVKVIDQLTDVVSVQTRFQVDTVDSADPFGDGSVIARYQLDSDVLDTSINGHDGTPTAITYTTGTDGAFVEGAVFNGTTSQIALPTAVGDSQPIVAFSGWFRKLDTSTGTLLEMRNGTGSLSMKFLLRVTSTDILLDGRQAGAALTIASITTSPIPHNGAWRHVVAQVNYTTKDWEIFLDNVSIGSGNNALITDNVSLTNVTIGDTESTAYMNGDIDQVTIFNKMLSVAEVNTLFTETKILT